MSPEAAEPQVLAHSEDEVGLDLAMVGMYLCGCFYINWGVLLNAFGAGMRLIQGRFKADSYQNYVAVCVNWGFLLVAVLIMNTLLFGVYMRALDFLEITNVC